MADPTGQENKNEQPAVTPETVEPSVDTTGITPKDGDMPKPEDDDNAVPFTPQHPAEEAAANNGTDETPQKRVHPVAEGAAAEAEETGQNAEAQEIPQSKFLSQEDNEQLMEAHKRLLKAWNLSCLPNELEDALDGGEIKCRHDRHFDFQLKDGSSFSWTADKEGNEFIGIQGIVKLSENMATAQVLAAAAHGWREIDVYGTESNKEKLWLAAQKAGLHVANFEPRPDSTVFKQWQKQKNDMTQVSIAPAREHITVPPAETAETPVKPEEAKPAEAAASKFTQPAEEQAPAAAQTASVPAAPRTDDSTPPAAAQRTPAAPRARAATP